VLVRVRDDDVLLQSRGWENPFARFRQLHEWILETDCVVHVPAILVNEIQEYPDCIAYVKEQTQEGRMLPEVHGMEHIDYGKLTKEDARDRLLRAKNWINDTFGYTPTIYYSQWGASQPHLHEAAAEVDLVLIDTSKRTVLEGPGGVIQKLKDGLPPAQLNGVEVMIHWWNAGARLARMCQVIKHGSWDGAKAANPKLF